MLREKRMDAGISQQGLAYKTGIPLRTIQHWEAGHVGKAAAETLAKVAKVLDCTIEDLL